MAEAVGRKVRYLSGVDLDRRGSWHPRPPAREGRPRGCGSRRAWPAARARGSSHGRPTRAARRPTALPRGHAWRKPRTRGRYGCRRASDPPKASLWISLSDSSVFHAGDDVVAVVRRDARTQGAGNDRDDVEEVALRGFHRSGRSGSRALIRKFSPPKAAAHRVASALGSHRVRVSGFCVAEEVIEVRPVESIFVFWL